MCSRIACTVKTVVKYFHGQFGWIFFTFLNTAFPCFICCTSDSTVSEDGLQHWQSDAVTCSSHLARPHNTAGSYPQLGKTSSTTRLYLIHNSTRLHPQLSYISSTTQLYFIHISATVYLIHNSARAYPRLQTRTHPQLQDRSHPRLGQISSMRGS